MLITFMWLAAWLLLHPNRADNLSSHSNEREATWQSKLLKPLQRLKRSIDEGVRTHYPQRPSPCKPSCQLLLSSYICRQSAMSVA